MMIQPVTVKLEQVHDELQATIQHCPNPMQLFVDINIEPAILVCKWHEIDTILNAVVQMQLRHLSSITVQLNMVMTFPSENMMEKLQSLFTYSMELLNATLFNCMSEQTPDMWEQVWSSIVASDYDLNKLYASSNRVLKLVNL